MIKNNAWNIEMERKYIHNILIVCELQEESARSPTPTRRCRNVGRLSMVGTSPWCLDENTSER